jgi:rSAM/selenodomain-associated transferase 1
MDKIAQVRGVTVAEPVLAYAPEGAGGIFDALAPGFRLLPQRGVDLTSRLISVLERLFEAGLGGAVVIDSDTPTLPSAFLERAVTQVASKEHDLVLGPSEDGGYYLIGLGRIHRALFEDMSWSTPAVLEETLRRARDLGLTVVQLDPWYDVDTGADLDRLAAELEAGGDKGPRHTRRLLLSLGRTSASGGSL